MYTGSAGGSTVGLSGPPAPLSCQYADLASGRIARISRREASAAAPCGRPSIEDPLRGHLSIADAELRAAIAEQHPATWARIALRQAFLRERLGIDLGQKILPLSDTAGYLPPFWLPAELASRSTD